MNSARIITLITIIALVQLGDFKLLYSQTEFSEVNSIYYSDDINIITDRDIFCVNESILFSAFLRTIDASPPLFSKVLYIEIVMPNGDPILQNKFKFNNSGTDGSLLIPPNTLTGVYYLKAYTNWMKNFPTSDYLFKPITIINPSSNELLQATNTQDSNYLISLSTDSLESDLVSIKLNKKNYKIREKIEVQLSIKQQHPYPFSISVVKPFTLQNTGNKRWKSNTINKVPKQIPETRGLSLSGRVINEIDSQPIPFTKVNLTIFHTSLLSYGVIANDSGYFYFALPDLEGELEFFASAEQISANKKPILLVNYDFCSKPVSLPYYKVNIDSNNTNLLNELAINSQLSHVYSNNEITKDTVNTIKAPSFYGTPTTTILLSNFIELPTIADYFTELIPQVSIRNKTKNPYFKINGLYPESNIYSPLVLVDMVAISNIKWVLSISPRKIESIEIINKPYIKGNIIYGGVISIKSTDGDFAGVNLPPSGKFFTYSMFNITKPKPVNHITNVHLPDNRNTLYWNPSVTIQLNKPYNFSFNSSDTKGIYYIIVKSIDKNGKIIVDHSPIIIE